MRLDRLADAAVNTAAREDAALVVAELVSNAVLHGVAPIAVRVQARGGVVYVAVHDFGAHAPVPVPAGPGTGAEAITGRGLLLVAALSRGWGVEFDPCDGEVVWADVDVARRRRRA